MPVVFDSSGPIREMFESFTPQVPFYFDYGPTKVESLLTIVEFPVAQWPGGGGGGVPP